MREITKGSKRIAIVGAGPSGCALATFCSRAGHEVVIYDRHAQSRVVVGESLLPFGNRVLEMLGLSLEGFVEKRGAVFVRKGENVRFDFSDAERTTWTQAHQVERAVFDARLRSIAQKAGAKFVCSEIGKAPEGVDWVVDATGRQRALGRKWTRFSGHASLRNAAISAHFRNVGIPPFAADGDIVIYCLKDAWCWLIPLSQGIVSLGLVTSPSRRGLKWEQALLESEELNQALEGAERVTPFLGHQDFTEYAETFTGDGWALVGDAAMFLDPVFSSGVLFALEGAERLSRVINGEIEASAYEEQMRSAAKMVESLIVAYYNNDFLDLSFAPKEIQSKLLLQGMVSLLAGDVFDGGARMAAMMSRRIDSLANSYRGG